MGDGRWNFDEARRSKVRLARRDRGMRLRRGVLGALRCVRGWLRESERREGVKRRGRQKQAGIEGKRGHGHTCGCV